MQELQNEIHAHNVNVGWWDDVDEWTISTKLMLTVSEVAEAMEGDRKNLMDDKVPHRTMLEVELADVLIRTLDIGGYLDFHIDPNIESHIQTYVESSRCVQVAPNLLSIVYQVIEFSNNLNEHRYNMVIVFTMAVSKILNCDLLGAVNDKRAYNASRADHKRENRQKEHGKKY